MLEMLERQAQSTEKQHCIKIEGATIIVRKTDSSKLQSITVNL